MNKPALAVALALAAALSACRAKPVDAPGAAGAAYAPPVGKRGFSLAIDKSQTQFLAAGDAVEVVILLETPRTDGASDTRSEVLAPRAEVLRVNGAWGETTGLIQLALTPEETQLAALAADREDRLFLNKVADAQPLKVMPVPEKPVLAPGQRGMAVLVYPDQQEFVEPGDRVDVVATGNRGKSSGKSELTATTLFQDVLVLGARAAEGNEEWSTVQLMMSPERAKILTRAVASEDALVLAVRAPGDAGTRPVEPASSGRKFSPRSIVQ